MITAEVSVCATQHEFLIERCSRFQSSLSVSFSTWVVWCLAAHVGIFDLHTEQSSISTHAELVPLPTFIKIQISCRVRDACGIEHDWSIKDDAVLLQREKSRTHSYFSSVTHQIRTTRHNGKSHTYSPELDASTHFKLYGPAHDVDSLVTTNDGLAVPFNIQVRRRTACDLN